MARKKWDTYKVARGTPLTRAKTSSGGFRGLVHGAKGVSKHAEFFKADKKRSLFGTLLAFATKSLLVVLVVGAVIAICAVLISAVVDGVAAGLAGVADDVSAASEYLVLGAGVAAVITVGALGIKVARFFVRRQTDKPAKQFRSSDATPTLAQYVGASGYGNEAARTHYTAPAAASPTNPADWYPDPSNAAQFRYWNGTAWTHEVAPRNGTVSAAHSATTPSPDKDLVSSPEEPRITMSSSEWQAHVRAWMTAGAVEQELWRRLSKARISDADQVTLEAQRQMEQLTAEEGAQRIRLLLEAKPELRDELGLTDFLTNFLSSQSAIDRDTHARVDRASETRRP